MNMTILDTKVDDGIAPVISVAMPVYNGERYLAEAIDSILSQTFADFELIIIDDGSTDNSLQVLREYQKRDARIRLIARENRDLATTLNDIIGFARGKWIARMDQDDIALPHRFERQLKWLEQTGADLCGSWIQYFGAGDRRIWKTFQTDEAIKMDMLFKCPIAHPTVIMRAKLIKHLRYDKAWEKAEDYELWIRAAMAGWKMANVQEVLLLYRRHKEQISTATYSKQQLFTIQARKKFGAFMSEKLGLDKDSFEDLLLLGYADEKPNLFNLELTVENLLRLSDGEAKFAVSQGLARNCFKIAADHPDVVAILSKLNDKFGVGFSYGTMIKLMLVRLFRVRFGGRLFIQLVKLYGFVKGSSRI